jgi:PAS domain S-box-containing protein
MSEGRKNKRKPNGAPEKELEKIHREYAAVSSIFEMAGALIIVLDTLGRIVLFNRACEEVTGYPAEEVEGKAFFDLFILPDELKGVKAVFKDLKSDKFPSKYENHWRTKNGDRRLISWSNTVMHSESGEVEFIVSIGLDITERMQVEEELQRKSHDLGERVKELNCLYGISRLREDPKLSVAEMLQRIVELIPPAWHYPGITCARISVSGSIFTTGNFAETSWRQHSKVQVYGEDIGTVEVFYLEGMPELDEGPFLAEERKLIDAIAERIGRIIEHRQTEARAREYQDELRSLASEMALVEERERRRIAVELHDHVGHALAISKFKLEDLRSTTDAEELEQAIELIDETIKSTRSLTFELSPPVLHELGFIAALDWLCKQMRDKHGLNVEFRDDEVPKRLAEDTRMLVFQAMRELLVNAVKHSRASQVLVQTKKLNGDIQVTVEDNGVGFDPSAVAARRGKEGGFGLFNMSERLGYLGGRLEVDSAPGRGTIITLIAPLKADGESQAPPAPAIDRTRGLRIKADRRIKILLAEDHQITREGLRALLEREPDLSVVAEADNGAKAVELALEHAPDIVIMDIAMPEMNGIEATKRIVAELPQTKVVALSMHADKHYVLEMLRAGASGYLLKDCAQVDLARAVRTVDANLTFLSPEIADTVVEEYARYQSHQEQAVASVLTPREREVLALLAEGSNTKEIGLKLGVSVKTVETHRQHVMDKLNLHSVAELTKYAIKEGLIGIED